MTALLIVAAALVGFVWGVHAGRTIERAPRPEPARAGWSVRLVNVGPGRSAPSGHVGFYVDGYPAGAIEAPYDWATDPGGATGTPE